MRVPLRRVNLPCAGVREVVSTSCRLPSESLPQAPPLTIPVEYAQPLAPEPESIPMGEEPVVAEPECRLPTQPAPYNMPHKQKKQKQKKFSPVTAVAPSVENGNQKVPSAF